MANKVLKNNGTIAAGEAASTEQAWDTIVRPGWEEKYADLPTGIRMCYCEMGPADGDVIVLLHGAGDSRISWSRVAPILAETGRRVLVPEMRGHGKTDLPKPERGYYVMEDYAADIVALLDLLGVKQADLAGHSCGSLTMQLAAAERPDLARSLTLIASGVTVDSFQEMTVPEDAEPFDDAFCQDWAACTILDPVFREASYQYVRQLSIDAWKWIINGIKYFDSSDRLSKITCPVQIIWGTEDAVFHAEDQAALRAGLVNAEVSFVELAGCSHSPHWDSWENIYRIAGLLLAISDRSRGSLN